MDRLDLLIEEIGPMLPTPATLKFTDDCCPIELGDVVLNLQRDDAKDRLIISGYIAELPETDNAWLMEQCLIANLYWQLGGTLCLEPDSRSLILLHWEPSQGLAPHHLLAILKDFAASITDSRQRLQEHLSGNSADVQNYSVI